MIALRLMRHDTNVEGTGISTCREAARPNFVEERDLTHRNHSEFLVVNRSPFVILYIIRTIECFKFALELLKGKD